MLTNFLFVVGGFIGILAGARQGWKWIYNPWFRIAHLFAVLMISAEDVFRLRRVAVLLVSIAVSTSCLLAQPNPNAISPTYETLNAVLWAQSSIEFESNAIQTYKAAEAALQRALKEPHWTAALEQVGDFGTLPPAVVLDLDETVLDNSSLRAQLIRDGKAYSDQAWDTWVSQKRALAIPGAVHFLNAALLSGVAPIYITNRVCQPNDPNDSTVQVLVKLRIPLTSGRLLCRSAAGDASDKSPRRTLVSKTYRILLLIGDDVNDFLTVPAEMSTVAGRDQLLRVYEPLWGEKWFILPNAMYGSWERTIGFGLQQKLDALRP